MKIAVLSDQHIHTAAAPESWDLAHRAFRAAAGYDHVILAGDTFDSAGAFDRDHARVRDSLRDLGLWHRDRLTVVPGNHDLSHFPHRGTSVSRALEYAKTALSFDARGLVRDSAVERAFDDWVRPLTRAADRLDSRRPFPMRKMLGNVALYTADTNPMRTLSVANGFWRPETDDLLRSATPSANERRVLAIHHPPKESAQTSVADVERSIRKRRPVYPAAFPPKNFARLEAFVDDVDLDAVVCGHIHAASTYTWTVGRSKVRAYMVGRTGGMHRQAPMFGVLTVPVRGKLKWREVEL